MKRRLPWIAIAVATVIATGALGSCATVPPAQQEGRVVELIDRLNTVPVEEFLPQTGLPFLFVDQVLYAESDVLAVLERLRDGELVIAPGVVGSSPADEPPEGARFDVTIFFDRLPDDAQLVLVQSNAGDLTLILGDEENGLPLLLGVERGRL